MRRLRADGILVVGGVEYGPAQYDLVVTQTDRWKQADGVIHAASGLHEAMEARAEAIVRLPSGVEVKFVVTRYQFGADHAQVKANGAVPGM